MKDGAPLLKKAFTRRSSPADSGEIGKEEFTSQCDLRFAENAPEIDFYLTAFGLQEPTGITAPTSSRWYLWIGLAAFCALSGGVGIRAYRKRLQNTSPTKS